ncbi:MAG: hypothetical protein HYU66_20000 [Armatimonadetes bacterium]|nr:hypothetical protein [Armatimonadota bacterium]
MSDESGAGAEEPVPRCGWVPAGVTAVLAYAAALPLTVFGWPWLRVALPLGCVGLGWAWQCGGRRAQRVASVVLGLEAGLFVLIAVTPLAPMALRRLTVDNAPPVADLIVVLSGGGGQLSPSSRERLLHPPRSSALCNGSRPSAWRPTSC